MKKKSPTTFGYIMKCLNIQTVSMARALHVDASLISKWKNGDRTLSSKSIYFNDVIDYLLEQSTNTMHQNLQDALLALYPNIILEDETKIEHYLRLAINSKKTLQQSVSLPLSEKNTNSITTLVFERNEGRREAVERLLDFAESMESSGNLLFVENEDFHWLIENPTFAKKIANRIEALIHKGFHATFVLYYSSRHTHFTTFFDYCSSLIYHRNVDWYCHSYYDDVVINFSFVILNEAISLLGSSSKQTASSTLVFHDPSLVLTHQLMCQHIIEQSTPLFEEFRISQSYDVLNEISHFRKKGTLYSCLPAPAFLSVQKDLLEEILEDNDLPDKTIKHCIGINRSLRHVMEQYFSPSSKYYNEPFIYIFRLEELIRRGHQEKLRSRSLTLTCGTPVFVKKAHFAQELRYLAHKLQKHPNLQVALVSEKDDIVLPAINCWCKKDTWMVQMNKSGFRISSEYNIVSAASSQWEHCLRSVPAERRDNIPVSHFLLELATDIEEKPSID